MRIRLEPVNIGGLEGGVGLLAFCDDRLVAVVVKLGEAQAENAGLWFVEKAFGRLDRTQHPLFAEVEDLRAWIAAEMADEAGGSPFDRHRP